MCCSVSVVRNELGLRHRGVLAFWSVDIPEGFDQKTHALLLLSNMFLLNS